MDRVEYLLVAGAAAEVAGQCLPDLGVCRIRVSSEQVVGGNYEPGRAEPALHPSGLDERLLNRVEVLAIGYRFDGDDLAALGLAGEHQARADEHAVQVDGAGPALALLAGVLRPGEPEPFAQDVEEALALPDTVGLPDLAVHLEPEPHTLFPSPVLVPGPLQRAPRKHADGVGPVGCRAADVAYRAGYSLHHLPEAY